MKKYLLLFSFSALFASLHAQVITFIPADTIAYGIPGSTIYVSDSIKNNSSAGIYVDVMRVVNDTAPNWKTSYCLDVCYPPSVDSARVYILANSFQMLLMDFYTDANPDTSMALMKFKNVSNPSNVMYQKLYGITDPNAGVNETHENNFSVNIFPSPVAPNTRFCFHIDDKYTNAKNYSLSIYDLVGRGIRIDHKERPFITLLESGYEGKKDENRT